MNLRLVESYERPDMAMGGKILVFLAENKEGRVHRLEVIENSPRYKDGYNLKLCHVSAEKDHKDIFLIDVEVKPGTVEIDPLKPFQIEIREKGIAFQENLKAAFTQDAPERNTKKYTLKTRKDLE